MVGPERQGRKPDVAGASSTAGGMVQRDALTRGGFWTTPLARCLLANGQGQTWRANTRESSALDWHLEHFRKRAGCR